MIGLTDIKAEKIRNWFCTGSEKENKDKADPIRGDPKNTQGNIKAEETSRSTIT